MNVQNGTRRQSWRQSGSSSRATGGSLALRRMITSVLLACLLLGAIAIIAYLFSRRYQHTRVSSLFTASQSNTSEPERSFTWLPLRFGSESLAPLMEQSSPQLQITSLTTSFDNVQKLETAIQKQIDQLQRNDAFILWVRAKGASFADKAYLLNGDYRLPQSGEQISDPQGAIPFKTIVDAVSKWPGPSLLLLDWGNQLSDPRAGMWDNQFLYWVVSDISQAPNQVHCLVSHQSGELSLDTLPGRQTLFGRACAEGLVGARRAPLEFAPTVQAERSLLVGDLAEYVIRRVITDSAETQKPWLIRGNVGWVEAERKNWNAQTSMPLMQLNAQHRPLGWSDEETDETALSSSTETSAQSVNPPAAVVDLTSDQWPTAALWQTLDRWREPSPKFDGWSLASLAPLTARRMATRIMDLECRWLAGSDFRGEASGANLRARIESLQTELQSAADEVEQASQSGPFSVVLGPSPDNVPPNEISNWKRRVETVAAYRKLAITLSDAIALSDTISKRDNVSSELRQAAGRAIDVVKAFQQFVPVSAPGAIDRLTLVDAVPLTRDLINCREDLDAQIAQLVNQSISNPLQERPLAELLSRYCWLSFSQRQSLLLSMMSAAADDDDNLWPTKDLSLLQPRPPQLRAKTNPQMMDLVEAVMAQLPTESASLPASPEQLVTALSKVARELRDTNEVSEALWPLVDGRDLCQKESGWPAEAQQPPLPSVPQPLPGWRVAWQNAMGGQLNTSRLQFSSTSEPASLDLMLTRIGTAQNIDSIEIRLSGVEARLGDTDTPWLRDSMLLSQADLLRVVDLKANSQRLPIEVRSLSNDPKTQREIQVSVRAGADSPPEQRLSCLLPVVTPVTLAVQQSVCREGITRWENCPQRGSLFTIQPFPGRQTEFRLLVTNQDQQARTATVELYRLSSRSANNAKGRIGVTGDEVPLELEDQDLRSFTSIASSAAIELAPNQSDVEVNLSQSATPSTGEPGTAGPGNADKAPASATTASSADISWGMLAVVRLKSEPNLAWRTWLQIKPVLADDFLSTAAQVSSDRLTLEVQVGLKDANQNNIPDWIPTDFNDERPIIVQCAVGDGIDMRQATLPMPEQMLTKDKSRQTFTISSESQIESEVEVQMNVDGSVRALFEFVGVGGRAARREPPDRIWLREIGIKDGLNYLSGFKRNLGEKERLLDNYGAMFRRPVPSSIQMVLSVDTQSRRIVDAPPVAVGFRLVGPTWEHAFGQFYGERDLQASLVDKSANSFKVTCQLSDWTFEFDPRSLGDVTATFQGSAGSSGERSLAKLVLDGLGPSLTQSVKAQEIVEGKNGQLRFEVEESVSIGQGKILIGPAGKPSQAAPLIEGLSIKDFDPTKRGWQLRLLSLPIQEYAPGRYDVSVQLEDILGNSSTFGPWGLTIKPKPQPTNSANGGGNVAAQPLKGEINGRVFFGAVNNKSPNPVKVSIKDQPDKSTTSSDGKFTLSGIEAGEYTVEAQTQWQGAVYKGEANVKLQKKADYQKLIDITLSK